MTNVIDGRLLEYDSEFPPNYVHLAHNGYNYIRIKQQSKSKSITQEKI